VRRGFRKCVTAKNDEREENKLDARVHVHGSQHDESLIRVQRANSESVSDRRLAALGQSAPSQALCQAAVDAMSEQGTFVDECGIGLD
jgi:hypothetical protein